MDQKQCSRGVTPCFNPEELEKGFEKAKSASKSGDVIVEQYLPYDEINLRGFMGKILITGVNGYLGGIITKEILENSDYDVLAVASSQEKVEDMLTRMQITEKEMDMFRKDD